MLTSPSLARSESITRSRVTPRVVNVSGTKPFSSPSTEVSASIQVSKSEHAQTRNINLKTSQPFTLHAAPRSLSKSAAAKNSGKSSISDRPSTSSGTSTRQPWNQTQWGNIHKNRESRDDTYFALTKTNKEFHRVETSEFTANRIPMPTALPTPDATPPRGPSPEERLTEDLVHMYIQNQNDFGIGMALGSPTHPQHDLGRPPYRANTNDQVQESKRPNEVVSPVSTTAKQKQSKWKGIGSLFGRKAPKPSASFYQLDGPPPRGNAADFEQSTSFGNPTPPDSADSKSRGKSNTTSKRSAPPRSNTTPVGQKKEWGQKQDKNQGPSEVQIGDGPKLDVEIPSIQLDRYSVMFSGVLGNGGAESSSSLLARRQATLDKLKTVNEAIARTEREQAEAQKRIYPRRATSPQPTKSPAFSLFPTMVTTPSLSRTPSPLPVATLRPQNSMLGITRSNTSPAALSPNRSTFNSDAESHIIMLDDGKALLNGIPPRSGMNKKIVQFSAQDSTLILSPQSIVSEGSLSSPNNPPPSGVRISSDSSDEEEDDGEVHVNSLLKPKINEPEWEIMNASTSEIDIRPEPFEKELDMIDRIAVPTVGRGRSGTLTQASTSPSTLLTAQSSQVASPASDITHQMSPLRSHPLPTSPQPSQIPTPQSHTESQSTSPEPLHKYASSISPISTSSSTATSTSPTSATDAPRRARTIKAIRAEMEQRQAPLSRSAQRELQRDIERAKVQAELEEAERTLESAAGLSIARQISISQRQRQLLKPISTTRGVAAPVHRKAIGSGSIGSITGSERAGSGVGNIPIEGLGSNRENDAVLLSSGGFNDAIPSITYPENHTRESPSSSQSTIVGAGVGAGGFDFNRYERPSVHQDRNQSFDRSPRSIATAERNTSGRNTPEQRPTNLEREKRPSNANTVPKSMVKGMGARTMSSTDSSGRLPVGIGMGMGSVVKREINTGTPTLVEPESSFGHRYQRSERVVLES